MTNDTGASFVEYGIILAAIAGAIVLVAGTLGTEVVALFQTLQWP